jgi:membrane protease YdiL (CAAX protease family)
LTLETASLDVAVESPRPSRARLGVALWLAGMLGLAAFAMLPLPESVATEALRVPLWVVQVIGLVQSGLLLALAVALGTRLAPAVKLVAPVFEALVARTGVWRALRPQLAPGLIGALAGGIVLLLFRQRAPSAVTSAVANGFDPSLLVRVLYGGITEELLLRWGVMTLLLWIVAPGARRRGARPGRIAAAVAILGSALLFGLGHLPTIVAYGGTLTPEVVLWTLTGNALFGIVVGVLFRRHGLEAAMLAHGFAHVVAFIA